MKVWGSKTESVVTCYQPDQRTFIARSLGNHMENNKLITHFHDGYPSKAAPDHVYKDKFLPGFSELKSELNDFINLKGLVITVLNASPYSKLNVFHKIKIEQSLSFR